tara:strand:- start:1413 stop:1706 length:294 start_codon:yes stop_codon:yes gene_type:complete
MEKIKTYELRKLIDGYKINFLYSGQNLVALPYSNKNAFSEQTLEKILVKYEDKKMVIDKDTPLLAEKTFPDKFGRKKTYTLYYYEWKPTKNQIKLEF